MTSPSDRYKKRPGTCLMMSYALRLEPGRSHVAVSANSIALFVGAMAYKSNDRDSSGSLALLQRQVRTTSDVFSIPQTVVVEQRHLLVPKVIIIVFTVVVLHI